MVAIFKSSSNIWVIYALVHGPEDARNKIIPTMCINKPSRLNRNQVLWIKIHQNKLLRITMS